MTKVATKFRTQFDAHSRIRQRPGSGMRILYSSELLPNGELSIVPSGREDLYASIQSHKDSCDIHVLLARYNNGDVDALSRVQGVYGDFTQLPRSYAELLNSVIAGKSYFESLPVETRANFDHSFEKFMMSMDNMENFAHLMGFDSPAKSDVPGPSPAPETEVAPNE